MISIVDELAPCTAEYPVARCIRLCFADVNEETMWGAMTKAQAEAIHSFVTDVKDEIDVLHIHCFAGQSRSPAIAAAILRGLHMEDAWIWSDRQYRPNPLCFRLVSEAFAAGRIFFTADLHLGNRRAQQQRPRFSNVGEMDAAILRNWNATVEERDTVYIVGDVAFQDAEAVRECLSKLRGKKALVKGDGDFDELLSLPENRNCFLEIRERRWIDYAGRSLTLCHYPMLAWNGSRRENAWQIHGHVHDNRDEVYRIIREYLPHVLNCGIDVNGDAPVSFEQLVRNNAAWYGRSV